MCHPYRDDGGDEDDRDRKYQQAISGTPGIIGNGEHDPLTIRQVGVNGHQPAPRSVMIFGERYRADADWNTKCFQLHLGQLAEPLNAFFLAGDRIGVRGLTQSDVQVGLRHRRDDPRSLG